MLMLTFYLGDDQYALECCKVIEITPKVHLKSVPHTAECIAGILNFRGLPVPVIDLCKLVINRSSANKFHTRIIVIEITDKKGKTLPLGVIAEEVTETKQFQKEDFIEDGIDRKEIPYLGGIFYEDQQVIRLFRANELYRFINT